MGDPCDLAAMRAASDVLHEQGNVLHQYVIAGMLTRAANELESLRSSHTALLAVLEPAKDAVDAIRYLAEIAKATVDFGGDVQAETMENVRECLEDATALEAALKAAREREGKQG